MYSCVISAMSREIMKMDDRDSVEYQNWEKKDIDGIIGFDLNDNNAKIVNNIISYKLKMSQNVKTKTGEMQKVGNGDFLLERERLLSRTVGDPTVGSRRDKKGSCSTRRGLRVGIGFKEFRQTPRGRGFSLLGFYTSFKCIYNV